MQPGDRIGQYVLIEQIGIGGQAVVWSAEDRQLKRTVAIKTINLATPQQAGMVSSSSGSKPPSIEEQVQRFSTEAQIIADLEHPYILPVYAFGRHEDWLYIVMRYMAGGTLKRLVGGGPLPVDEVIKLAEPLADALDMAHQRQIVHRDIKTVNILLDAQNRPYLADFGLSVTTGDARGTSGSGTLAYMAPEQLKNAPFDHRSDIYSFGLLIYEMLVGLLPTINGQHWNLMQMINAVELPVPATIPDSIAFVLRRATALDPRDRYNRATELVQTLKETQQARQKSLEDDDILLPISDPAMQASIDAHNLFDAALAKWADGAGRFRLYEEDFQFVDSFYADSDEWGIDLDDAGKRLMLRAALEHGYHEDIWWERISLPSERRAVTLQTLNSELPTARKRAIDKLRALEDSHPPAIPIRVATIIHGEPDPDVRAAGVRLLESRAEHGTMWLPFVYSETIDGVLADLAAKDPDPGVAELAARAIGRLRSTLAAERVAQLAAGHSSDARHAQKALISIRDEAPQLPPGVPAEARRRAFTALTVRQLFTGGLLGRYLSALLGFAVGWGVIQFTGFLANTGGAEINTLILQNLGNATASGALFGALAACGITAAIEPARRLRAWNRVGRFVVSLLAGTLLTMVAFVAIRALYYFTPEAPPWGWLVLLCVLWCIGLSLGAATTRKPWVLTLLASIGVCAALLVSYSLYYNEITLDQLLVFLMSGQEIPLAAVMAVSVGVLAYLPEWWKDSAEAVRRRTGL